MDNVDDSYINFSVNIDVLTPLNREADRAELENLEIKRTAVIRSLGNRDFEQTVRAHVKDDLAEAASIATAHDVEATYQMNASDQNYLFDLRDRIYYRRTPFDVKSHLIDATLHELSDEVAWRGSIRIYDPAFIDVAITKLNIITASPFDSSPGKIVLRFGSDPSDFDASHTYIGFITRVNLELTPQGTYLNIDMVSDSLDWHDVRVNPQSRRLSLKPTGSNDATSGNPLLNFAYAFEQVSAYAQWVDCICEPGLRKVPIGEDLVMLEKDTYLSFMQRIAKKAHTENGEQAYFHVYPPRTANRPVYFFGSASYARSQGLTGSRFEDPDPNTRLIFGASNSNVIEAQIDSDALFAAVFGANKALFRPYHLDGSANDYAYLVIGGIPKTITTERANEIVTQLKDKQRIIEIPMEAQATPYSAKNNIYAYLNSLRQQFLKAKITVVGTHRIRILDVVQFDYATLFDGQSVNNPVSGKYRCIGVHHFIDQNRGWTTTYDLQRECYSTSTDNAMAEAEVIITPKNLQQFKEALLDEGRKHDAGVQKKAEIESISGFGSVPFTMH